jgi:calcium permeable stress-gated cation channel
MFYQLYKYLFLYVYQQPTTTDTGGMFYPKAFQHVLTGLYVQQICLCALFFLATDGNGHHGSIAEGALMVVLIVITVSLIFSFFFLRLFKKMAVNLGYTFLGRLPCHS